MPPSEVRVVGKNYARAGRGYGKGDAKGGKEMRRCCARVRGGKNGVS